MKILMTSSHSINKTGGVENFIKGLVNILNQNNIKTDILCGDFIIRKSCFNALEELCLSFILGIKINRISKNYDLIISNGLGGVFIRSHIPRIHIYHGTYHGVYACLSRLNLRKKMARFIRCYLEKKSGKNSFNIAVSETTRNEVERIYKNKIHKVINNSADLNEFTVASQDKKALLRKKYNIPSDNIVFLFSGQMGYRKGMDIYNQVAIQIIKEYPNVSFLVLTPRISAEYRQKHIHYLVGDKKSVIRAVYALSDVFFFPSRYEGYELVTIEAMASGLCPMGNMNVGAMSSIKERSKLLSKFLAQNNDVKEYKEKIKEYLSMSQDERNNIAIEARKYAETYGDKNKIFREWIEVIKEISD